MAHRAVLLALLLLAMPIAGCIEVRPEDIVLQTDEAQHTRTIAPPAGPPNLFYHVLTVTDLRDDPFSLDEPLRVAIHVAPTAPAPFNLTLRLSASWADQSWEHTAELTTGDHDPFTVLLPDLIEPGRYDIHVASGWEGGQFASAKTNGDLYTFTVYDRADLIIDANKSWYEDQKTFQESLVVPFAPWDDESGLDVLKRAAERAGFPLEVVHREDYDSYYILGINGTTEEWGPEGCTTGCLWSYSWMVHKDGKLTSTAIDDTYLEPGQRLGLRYLKCNIAGTCEA